MRKAGLVYLLLIDLLSVCCIHACGIAPALQTSTSRFVSDSRGPVQVWHTPSFAKSMAPMRLHRSYGGCHGDITCLDWSADSSWIAVAAKDLCARCGPRSWPTLYLASACEQELAVRSRLLVPGNVLHCSQECIWCQPAMPAAAAADVLWDHWPMLSSAGPCMSDSLPWWLPAGLSMTQRDSA